MISGGPRDELDVVTSAYAARGGQVLHTAARGAVRAVIDGGRISVDCWHAEPPNRPLRRSP